MSEEEKEAIEHLNKLVQLRKNKTNIIKYDSCICDTNKLDIALNLIQKQQKDIEKKDMIINEMAEYIVNLIQYNNPEEVRIGKDIKQYFERKAEEKE